METTDYMQVIPNSSFTVGDLIEVEIKNPIGGWILKKGRVMNDLNNSMMLGVLENTDIGSYTSFYIKGLEMRNVKVLEKGPWHKFIYGED